VQLQPYQEYDIERAVASFAGTSHSVVFAYSSSCISGGLWTRATPAVNAARCTFQQCTLKDEHLASLPCLLATSVHNDNDCTCAAHAHTHERTLERTRARSHARSTHACPPALSPSLSLPHPHTHTPTHPHIKTQPLPDAIYTTVVNANAILHGCMNIFDLLQDASRQPMRDVLELMPGGVLLVTNPALPDIRRS
jgi:hypothetical protein